MNKFRINSIGIVLAIFIVASCFRLIFLHQIPQPTVAYDAVSYLKTTKYLMSGVPWGKVVYRLSRRGPVYSLYLALLWIILGPTNIFAFWVSQALLNALVCVMLYSIGRDLRNRRVGLIAAGIATIYLPFFCSAAVLFTGSLATFLLTLSIFCIIRGSVQNKIILFLAGGFTLCLTALCRLALLWIPLLLLIPLVILILPSKNRRWMYFIAFITGISLVAVSWTIIARSEGAAVLGTKYGGFWMLNSLHTKGWFPDGAIPEGALPKTEWSSPAPHSMMLRLTILADAFYQYPYLIAKTMLQNFIRLWIYPYHAYWPPALLPYPPLFIFQVIVVFLAGLGIPLSLFSWRKSLILITVLIYATLSVITIGVTARYNLPFMPVVIIFSAFTLDFLYGILRNLVLARRWKSLAGPVIVTFLLAGLVAVFTLPVFLGVFAEMRAVTGRWLRLLLVNLLFLSSFWLWFNLINLHHSRRLAGRSAIFSLLLIVPLYNFSAITSPRWHQWEARLTGPDQAIHQEFSFPENLSLDLLYEPVLVIDLQKQPGDGSDPIVKANGHILKPRPYIPNRFYRKIAGWRAEKSDAIRHWWEFPISKGWLINNKLVVDISCPDEPPRKKNCLKLWGDYQVTPNQDYFEGPSLAVSDHRPSLTSLYKWIADNDPRIDAVMRLSNARISGYFRNNHVENSDLAAERGSQRGRYRIFLRFKKIPEISGQKLQLETEYVYF